MGDYPGVNIARPRDVFALLRQPVLGKGSALLWRLELRRRELAGLWLVSVGRIDTFVPSAHEVFAGVTAGSAVILAHNHPDQDVRPRDCDAIAAYVLDVGARARGIELHDFLILTDKACFSFRRRGCFDERLSAGGPFRRGWENPRDLSMHHCTNVLSSRYSRPMCSLPAPSWACRDDFSLPARP